MSEGSVSNLNYTATATTINFTATGTTTWTVPAGVSSINADGIGAAGGHGYSVNLGKGGNGGRLIADINTTPGEALTITIGEIGTDGWHNGYGGYNGGGSNPGAGGGGGGATDIRRGGND